MTSEKDIFTEEEKDLAARIITCMRRETAKKYSYLRKAVFYLTPAESSEVKYIGISYKKLYYNPTGVIELFGSNINKLENAFLHGILHCLLLHPSVGTEENELFDGAADVAVNAMIENINPCSVHKNKNLFSKHNCGSAVELYNKALTDNKLRKDINYLASNRYDDHCAWRIKEEDEENAAFGEEDENTWRKMFSAAKGTCGRLYGDGSGNIFAELKPPERFSRFSYKEYIRRFAIEELSEEDPENIDMLLYTTSMEMYGDTPIVEWNPVRERSNPSDIIIAVDMSGSCGGGIAVNFLRQVYTLFDEMDINNNVNIHTVFFDTKILGATVIRNKNDADRFISEYTARGFGGTDFNCVFDYADNFASKSKGKKLKALFFFSDACGAFPKEERSYPTTFFVPQDNSIVEKYAPNWIELVRYDD